MVIRLSNNPHRIRHWGSGPPSQTLYLSSINDTQTLDTVAYNNIANKETIAGNKIHHDRKNINR